MNDNFKIIKDILEAEDRNKITRDRFFNVYCNNIKPVNSLAKEIGVSDVVVSNLIKGKNTDHYIKTIITILTWVLKREKELNILPV